MVTNLLERVLMYGPLICIGYMRGHIRGTLLRAHTRGPNNPKRHGGVQDRMPALEEGGSGVLNVLGLCGRV